MRHFIGRVDIASGNVKTLREVQSKEEALDGIRDTNKQNDEINRELLIKIIESPRRWEFKEAIEETLINYESLFGYDIEQCMIDLVEDVAKSKLDEAINNGIYPIQPLLNVVKAGEGKISFQLSI